MPVKDKRRKKDKKVPFNWNLTNIGAAMSLIGLVSFVLIIFFYLMSGYIVFPLAIVAMMLVAVGYAFIVKDHLDNKKKMKEQPAKRKSAPEEE